MNENTIKRCPTCSNELKMNDDIFCSRCGRRLHSIEIYYCFKNAVERPLHCIKYNNTCNNSDCAGKNISKCNSSFIEFNIPDTINQLDIKEKFSIVIKNKGETHTNITIEDSNQNNFLKLSSSAGFQKGINEIAIPFGEKKEIFFETDKNFENNIKYKFEIYDTDFEYARYCINLEVIKPSIIEIEEITFNKQEINILERKNFSFKISNKGDLPCQVNLNDLFLQNKSNNEKYLLNDLFEIPSTKEFSISRNESKYLNISIKEFENLILKLDSLFSNSENSGHTGIIDWEIHFNNNDFDFEKIELKFGFCFPAQLSCKAASYMSNKIAISEIKNENIDYIIENIGHANDLIIKDIIFKCEDLPIKDGIKILNFLDSKIYLNAFSKLSENPKNDFAILIYELILRINKINNIENNFKSEDNFNDVIDKIKEEFNISKSFENHVLIENENKASFFNHEEMDEFESAFGPIHFIKFKNVIDHCKKIYSIYHENKPLIFLTFIKCYEILNFNRLNELNEPKIKLIEKIKSCFDINIFEEMLEVQLVDKNDNSSCKSKRVVILNKKTNKAAANFKYEISLILKLKEWPIDNQTFMVKGRLEILSNSGFIDENLFDWKVYDVQFDINPASEYNGTVAIDFGTTNSCVAFPEEDETFTFKFDGEEILKSIVYFEDKKNFLIGTEAFNYYKKNPMLGVKSIKTFLGKDQRFILVDSKKKDFFIKTADEIIRIFMNEIIKKIQYKRNQKIKRLILTIPIDFITNQKETMHNILRKYNVSWLPEPIAYIYCYIKQNYNEIEKELEIQKKVYILNIDFGGGTTDLALVKVEFDKNYYLEPTVIAYDGRENFGGDLIDKKIRALILSKIQYEFDTNQNNNLNINNEFLNNPESSLNSYKDDERKQIIFNLRQLLNYAEKIKLLFSKDENNDDDNEIKFTKRRRNPEVVIPENKIKQISEKITKDIIISYDEYYSIIKEVIKDACKLVENITDIGKNIEGDNFKLSRILLSGQTFKSVEIRNCINEILSQIININKEQIYFDEQYCKTGIALGASEYAKDANKEYQINVKKIKYSYGYLKRYGLRNVFHPFAKRNEDNSKEFLFDFFIPPKSSSNNNEILIRIYINKSRDSENKEIKNNNEENKKNGIFNLGAIIIPREQYIVENFININNDNQTIKIIAKFSSDDENLNFWAIDKIGTQRQPLRFNFEKEAIKKIGDVY